ncbi:MAG: MFS transporter [Lactobacillus sp.]|nr:MFS transporter [Lactobacillus sp.]
MADKPITLQTKLAILATGLLSFTGILVETSLNVTFPTMAKQFNTALGTVQWLTSGYLLMVTIVMSTTAFLIKAFNTRALFRTAIIATLLGTSLASVAPSFGLLMAGRLLQAIATGLSTPLMFHVILSLIPENRLGVYMGFASMITSFAPALGPTYGGVLNYYFSWRMIFIVILPVIILVFFLGDRNIRLVAAHTNGKFDLVGTTLLALVLFGFIEVFAQGGRHGFISWPLGVTLLISLGFLVVFLYHVKHGKNQILNFKILTNPIVLLRAINFFLLQFMNIGISFVIPVFVQNYLGTNSMMSGLILLPGSLIGALVSPVAGHIYDEHGAAITLFIANGSMFIGACLFASFTHDLSLVGITLIYIFMRFGFNFGFGNIMSDASLQVPVSAKADLNSLFNTLQQYAGSLGTGVLSAVMSATSLHTANKAAVAWGAQKDFIILSVLSLTCLVVTVIALHCKQRQATV